MPVLKLFGETYIRIELILNLLSHFFCLNLCVHVCLFRSVMEKSFLEYYDFYEGVCKERLYLQGQNMQVGVATHLYLYQ